MAFLARHNEARTIRLCDYCFVEQAHFCDTSDKNKVNWVNPVLTSLSLELLLALI